MLKKWFVIASFIALMMGSAHQAFSAEEIWIDVRSAQEFAGGHVEGAINVPHTDIGGQIAQLAPDKETPVYLYCRSGRRAQQALQTLQSMGYTQVINLGSLDNARRLSPR